MTWLAWRQIRTQLLVTGAALAVLAVYLVVLGVQIREEHHDAVASGSLREFQARYQARLYLLDALLLVTPALLGMFWGAPLVARELESGTHRLVWNQSVSRRRWLLVRLAVVCAAAAALTGLFSLLLTWAASPYDAVAADRFTALLFGTRNLAPVAYTCCAVVLGALIGLLLRRTVPAMALTALLFAAVQVAVPSVVRPHLSTPVHGSQAMSAEVIRNLSFLGAEADVEGLSAPNAWVVSTSRLLTADGRTVDLDRYHGCLSGQFDVMAQCVAALDLHVDVAYHPGGHYWRFQWLESLLFLASALALAGVALWRIRVA
ncbi:ABC transporter permease subunit [Dactylosporangium sp. NBC_01737]|uniref:ABC transporter permease subunit n=1 Tax=Dactylosporangium sp. NBC_01737 TaxID=2975959 RepID=UPI002E140C4E|nr:ABC transporter permease subunit [Dactylosporangium sp. NBC_01737]